MITEDLLSTLEVNRNLVRECFAECCQNEEEEESHLSRFVWHRQSRSVSNNTYCTNNLNTGTICLKYLLYVQIEVCPGLKYLLYVHWNLSRFEIPIVPIGWSLFRFEKPIGSITWNLSRFEMPMIPKTDGCPCYYQRNYEGCLFRYKSRKLC